MTTGTDRYNDPKLAINRVYTRKGDRGETRLVGGQKVAKDALRIEAYGTVDELNSYIGLARQTIVDHHFDQLSEMAETLIRVQHDLFNLGSILACLPEDVVPQMPRVSEEDIFALEQSIDYYNEDLDPLRSFVLPGGARINAELHVCRTVCRRAERLVVALSANEDVDQEAIGYLNRLSDAFFVWSRAATHAIDADEVLWDPNRGSTSESSAE